MARQAATRPVVAKTTHSKAKGADGLTDREREFVRLRRAHPEKPQAEIMALAGYEGVPRALTERARQLMKKPLVAAAVIAPIEKPEVELTDEELKALIRKRFLKVVTGPTATDSDAIKAGDKLLATIPGGYVPVQVKQTGRLTLESWVRGMGGAPDDQPELPAEGDRS